MSEHLRPGEKIGRWTVGKDYIITPKGERKYLCRCECGTERYVLERSLKSGGSLSCGCLRKEQARKANAYDLTGKKFGDLTVICESKKQIKGRGIYWHCQCICGNTCEVLGSLLVTGRKTHCGCNTVKKKLMADITGKVFGRLTALYPTDRRDAKGYVIWHCKCSCGNEADVSYNELMYGNLRSCGCQKKEHDKALEGFLHHIDGTFIEKIRDSRPQSNSTTGCRGVYLIRGRYMAKIVFQKKAYSLGTYDRIEDAKKARREAEEAIFETAVPFYTAWIEKAKKDPTWAKEHPASAKVKRDQNGRFYLETMPYLKDIKDENAGPAIRPHGRKGLRSSVRETGASP